MHKSLPVLLVPHPSRNFGEGFLSTADIAFTAVGARIAWINVHTLRILAWSVHELPTLVFCRLQWTHLTVPLEPNGLFPLDECRWGSVDHFIALMGQKQEKRGYSYSQIYPGHQTPPKCFGVAFRFTKYLAIHIP
jgi:hypothetical protein